MKLYSTKILKYVVRDNILVVNKISLDFNGKHRNEKLIKNHVTTRVLFLTQRYKFTIVMFHNNGYYTE